MVRVDDHLLPSGFERYFAEISLVDIDNNVTMRYGILTKRPSLILPVDRHRREYSGFQELLSVSLITPGLKR